MNVETIRVCDHANERMKERTGIKSRYLMAQNASKAFALGLRESNCKGAELKYIRSYKKDSVNGERELVLYEDQIWVFEGLTLVTILPRDLDFVKKMEKIRRKNNRTRCRHEQI